MKWEGDVVPHGLERYIQDEMSNILTSASEIIVDTKNFVTAIKQPITEMRPKKPSATCYEGWHTHYCGL